MKISQRIHLAVAAAAFALLAGTATGAKFSSAEVTRVYNDVRLLYTDDTSEPADVGAKVVGKTAVGTGRKSRSELTFPDETIVRLGANTVFSFLKGKRDIQLDKGTLLFQAPKWRGRSRIKTAAVTAATTGTTFLFEYDPVTGIIKVIVLEGGMKITLNIDTRKWLNLRAGEMLVMKDTAVDFPKVYTVDLGQLTKTSLLINGGFQVLASADKINAEIQAQVKEKRTGRLLRVTRAPLSRDPRSNGGVSSIHNARVVTNRPPPTPSPRVSRRPRGGGGGSGGGGGGGGSPPRPAGPPDVSGPPGGQQPPPGFGGVPVNR